MNDTKKQREIDKLYESWYGPMLPGEDGKERDRQTLGYAKAELAYRLRKVRTDLLSKVPRWARSALDWLSR